METVILLLTSSHIFLPAKQVKHAKHVNKSMTLSWPSKGSSWHSKAAMNSLNSASHEVLSGNIYRHAAKHSQVPQVIIYNSFANTESSLAGLPLCIEFEKSDKSSTLFKKKLLRRLTAFERSQFCLFRKLKDCNQYFCVLWGGLPQKNWLRKILCCWALKHTWRAGGIPRWMPTCTRLLKCQTECSYS